MGDLLVPGDSDVTPGQMRKVTELCELAAGRSYVLVEVAEALKARL